jgi:radical SAM protein with 4Fe4S-binding SPASM domain
MRNLLDKLRGLRHTEQWEDLLLYLAVPFCLLDTPQEALELLHGRQSCGPISSLVIDPHGRVLRCYSRRHPLDIMAGLRAAAMRATVEDFERLPDLCRTCPVAGRCLGGCRCGQSLTRDGFDYLARPETARQWQKNLVKYLLS